MTLCIILLCCLTSLNCNCVSPSVSWRWVGRIGGGEPPVGNAPRDGAVAGGRQRRDGDQRRACTGRVPAALQNGLEIQNRAPAFRLPSNGRAGKKHLYSY